jgi:hypothetical protein
MKVKKQIKKLRKRVYALEMALTPEQVERAADAMEAIEAAPQVRTITPHS